MKSHAYKLLMLVAFATSLMGFDWRSLSNEDLLKWSSEIRSEIDHISAEIPDSQRNAYYWFTTSKLRYAANCIKKEIIVEGVDNIRAAIDGCSGLFPLDKVAAETCQRRLQDLSNGPSSK